MSEPTAVSEPSADAAAPRPQDLTVDELAAPAPPAVEDALLATVKTLAATTPAPLHDPFYGLDRRPHASLRLLARLSRHGDFRKYVFVLDAGAGLAGGGRWLALRYGCRVAALDRAPATLALARRLAARAGVGHRLCAIAGALDAVPVRDGTFTQIWSVEALQHVDDLPRAIAELHRVLRPGSPLALQEVVRRTERVPRIGGAWRHHTAAAYLTALADAGFTDVDHEDVSADRGEPEALLATVRAGFTRTLAERLPPQAPWQRAEAARAAVDAVVAGPDYALAHFFARRPST
jgi:SAM-dependent methyltransferase